ncbi:hypothetical protein HPP92_013614 [Vanilla planifolia]|uniref:Uncharacterized protein n=1 Tax=Vanilla planifolia TaxID=51239 RepID=A0A835QS19_VANPL|nr:hypothetical protein HPP92_013614 [Vanilla planifolia]
MTTALELRSMQVADLVLEKFLDYQTGHSYSLVDLAWLPSSKVWIQWVSRVSGERFQFINKLLMIFLH